MLGAETIRNISDVAAYRAAEEGRKPLPVWGDNPEQDCNHLPFLGTYCPVGYRPATYRDAKPLIAERYYQRDQDAIVDLMVDTSGFGDEREYALTFGRFAKLAVGGYWAIVETGQFQVICRLYVKDPAAPGSPGPDEQDVMCDDCGTVHDVCDDCAEDDPDEDLGL